MDDHDIQEIAGAIKALERTEGGLVSLGQRVGLAKAIEYHRDALEYLRWGCSVRTNKGELRRSLQNAASTLKRAQQELAWRAKATEIAFSVSGKATAREVRNSQGEALEIIRRVLGRLPKRGFGTVMSQHNSEIGVGQEVAVGDDVRAFCAFFNSAVSNRDTQRVFRERFRLTRIGVSNVLERRQNPNTTAVFKDSADGDYYAVPWPRQTVFFVVPRFDLAIQDLSYGPGAIGEVFRCDGFDRRLRYRLPRVLLPARFGQSGENWRILSRGKLDLGFGEDCVYGEQMRTVI